LTGTLLPDRKRTKLENAFDWILELHYTLLMGDWGMVIAGLLAVLLCLLGLSGVYLYRDFWKSFFLLRWGRSARIFLSDLHKMTGISSVVFNLILGFTGAWWNLPTLKSLIAGQSAEIEDSTGGADKKEGLEKHGPLYDKTLSLDALVSTAAQRLPGLDRTKVYLNLTPDTGQIEVYGAVLPASAFVNEYNSHVVFDAETGDVTGVVDYRKATAWEKFEVMMGPLHFGTFGGWPVKLLWTVLGLSPGVLAVSGSLIWFRRRRQRRGVDIRSSHLPDSPSVLS
jgi:uncharacterized iron-regulated membrane protein